MNLFLNHPSVYNVDAWDLFNRLVAPSISTMQNYDVIATGFNWGWNPNYEPRWITVREDLGDRMADYLDMNAGGTATLTPSLDNLMFAGYPVFRLLGRYIDDKYAPYEIATTSFTSGALGEIFEPYHPVMNGVESGSVSNTLQGGDHDVTIGGGGMAAGQDGLNLADWVNEFSAVGAKELMNDAHTCHVNGFGPYMAGPSASLLTGNCALFAWGKGPTPKIPDFAYIYGDNGKYNVDLMLVDDDMGWVWDGTTLVADPRYPQTMTHSYTPISVNNVDPTIHSVEATIDMELCIRMSGNKGNMATLTLTGTDGYFDQVVAKRVPGKPVEACLDTATLDLTPRTKYEVGILYDPEDDDGANPTWIFETKFPDGKVKELRHTFKSELGEQTWLVANKQLKRLALGQEVHFGAVASDPGSDDLAFIWGWSDYTPYDICIYEHPGTFWGCAESDYLEALPFPEPDFTIAANDVRSPEVDPIRARDHQTHVFYEQYFYYVTLIVADDDVKDLYPSPYLTPGMDMQVVEMDF
jgi:hypothetical protein